MSHEWEAKFNEIVDGIEFETPPLQAGEINRAIIGATEAATYLGKILQVLLAEPGTLVTMNEDTATQIRDLIELTDEISAALSGCECPDCRDCECTEEEICEACMALYEYDEDDDED